MKNKFLATIFTIVLCVSMTFIPNLILSSTEEVEYVKPVETNIENYIFCNGKVVAGKEAEIYTDTPIYASEILYEIGDSVNIGDTLVVIDKETTSNILTSSTPLEASINKISELVDKLPDPKILYTIGKAYGISENQINDIYNSVKYNVSNKKVYYIPEEIKAPFSGTIINIGIKENVLSKSNEPAITICSNDKMQIVVDIDQVAAKKIYIGMKAEISDDSQFAQGEIVNIAPMATSTTGTPTVKATIQIDNTNLFKIGYAVDVKLLISENNRYLTLPIDAIMQDINNEEYVYVLSDGIIQKRNIEVGKETAYCSVVLDGIKIDDMVIVSHDNIDLNKKILIKGEKSLNEK